MKKLLICSLLVTLVSCNGNDKDSKSNSNPQGSNPVMTEEEANKMIFSLYEQAIRSQKAGMVIITESSGEDYDIEQDSEAMTFSAKKSASSSSDKEIILKIDGDLVYKYQEYKSGDDVSKSVTLENIAEDLRRTEESLKKNKFEVNGDRATIKFENELEEGDSYYDGSEKPVVAFIGGKFSGTSSVNLKNILCDSSSTYTVSGQTFVFPDGSQELEPVSQASKTSCAPNLSAAELKAIDLSKIEFCDETKDSEESNCEQDKDMSFLTSDL